MKVIGGLLLLANLQISAVAYASKAVVGRDMPTTSKTATVQELVLQGRVHAEGSPQANVTVREKNGIAQVVTDAQGTFTITLGKLSTTLTFTSVGLETKEVQVSTLNVLSVEMQEVMEQMDEVVVTALGITREEKEIGYAQQTISAEELATAASPNWSEGLKGKVAGLNIINGNTGPINSQAIQLRGTTSLDAGGNNALIVIDGVPMNQETTAYGNNVGAAYGTEALKL